MTSPPTPAARTRVYAPCAMRRHEPGGPEGLDRLVVAGTIRPTDVLELGSIRIHYCGAATTVIDTPLGTIQLKPVDDERCAVVVEPRCGALPAIRDLLAEAKANTPPRKPVPLLDLGQGETRRHYMEDDL